MTSVFFADPAAPVAPRDNDWTTVPLPPCTTSVRLGVDSELRYVRLVRAYYQPTAICPDPGHADREHRSAAGQVVVVAPDGAVLATWYCPPVPATPGQSPRVATASREDVDR